MEKLNRSQPWVRTLALRWGGQHLGVRVNSEAAARAVEALFSDARVPDLDVVAPANFSVQLSDTCAAGSRGLHFVFRDHVRVARRRDVADLLDDLAGLLETTAYPFEKYHLTVRACAVVTPERDILLLPPNWHTELLNYQRALAKDDIEVVARDRQLVETDRGLVRVRPRHAAASTPLLPLRAWAVRIDDTTAEPRTLRPAYGVQAVVNAVLNLEQLSPRTALLLLADLAGRTPIIGMPLAAELAMVDSIRRLAFPESI